MDEIQCKMESKTDIIHYRWHKAMWKARWKILCGRQGVKYPGIMEDDSLNIAKWSGNKPLIS